MGKRFGAKRTRNDQTTKTGRLKSSERREQILNTTLDLILDHGIAGTSMARIAERVGISEPALYKHFDGRHDILLSALNLSVSRLLSELIINEPDVPRYIHKVAMALFHSVLEHPENPKIIFEYMSAATEESLREDVREMHRFSINYIIEVLKLGQKQKTVRPDIDLILAAGELASYAVGMCTACILGEEHYFTIERAEKSMEHVMEHIIVNHDEKETL